MGFIYLIANSINDKKYVGQTIKSIEKRWNAHKACARKVIKENGNFRGSSYYLYRSMAKYGIDKYSISMLAEVDDSELDENEIRYISELNTVHPNGYNLTTGGGHFTHNEDTKKLMSKLAKENAIKYLDQYRKEETKGLPMYIVSHNKGKSRGYAVYGHELCSYKSFTLVKHKSLEECKAKAIEFLDQLNESGKRFEYTKKNADLPIGITKFRNGYLAKRKINGILYKKTFEGKDIADEVKLENAIKYLDDL